jgi:molybdopterin converting factor subunit 1
MITVRVKLFAAIRDLIGKEEVVLSLPPTSNVAVVVESLVSQYPKIDVWRNHVRIAVNQEYVSLEHRVKDNDEVVIIPPVSGG